MSSGCENVGGVNLVRSLSLHHPPPVCFLKFKQSDLELTTRHSPSPRPFDHQLPGRNGLR